MRRNAPTVAGPRGFQTSPGHLPLGRTDRRPACTAAVKIHHEGAGGKVCHPGDASTRCASDSTIISKFGLSCSAIGKMFASRGLIFERTGYGVALYPDDTGKDLAAVLSYLAGRTLSKEEIWTAMELPRSTYYDQLEKGTLITADNLGKAAANLGINRAELLTRYRFIHSEEVTSLAEEIAGRRAVPPPLATKVTTPAKEKWAKIGPPDTSVGLRAVVRGILWGGIDHCGSDRFVAVSGRGGFMRGAAALSWSTRSGRPALPAVVAREPPQGSPRQSASARRGHRGRAVRDAPLVGVRRVRAVRAGGRRGRASPGR